MKIAILLRVYNRMEDLLCNIDIIKKTWLSFDYDIFVISNGKENGYYLPDELKQTSSVFVEELEHNAGHISGSSQLLTKGFEMIPLEYKYVVILEADTWVHSDKILMKYIPLLEKTNAVWASAQWYPSYYSLATDFAVVDNLYIKKHCGFFDISSDFECAVANRIKNTGDRYLIVKENMPVSSPYYIKQYPFSFKNRFHFFVKSKMLTYHAEDLKGGMSMKKRYFNILSNTTFFEEEPVKCKKMKRYLINVVILSGNLFFKRAWITGIQYRDSK